MHTRPTDIATWLANAVSAAGAEGLVVPLDGRLGSAVTARLCQMAMEERTVGVLAADGPLSASAQDAQIVAETLQMRLLRLPLELACNRLTAALGGTMTGSGTPPVTADREWTRGAGLRQRVLMAAIYFVADSVNYLVAGSLDRTDLTIGTFTRHGDAAVDLLPLGQLLKSDVLAMASELQVPPAIIERAQAESLSTADSSYTSITGLTNADLERYLANGPDGVAPAVALRIERLMRASERRGAVPLTMAID
jgi:NAD+ synthase